MIRILRSAVVLLGLATLAACGPATIQSDVLRFSTLPVTAEGRSFALLPDDKQRGSLEFQAYADQVAKRLQSLGYRPMPASQNPELVVFLHYAVDDGRTEVWSTPFYSYHDYWSRHYGWPYYAEPPASTVYSTTVYTHRLEMKIVDGKSHRAGAGQNLFEGRAVAQRQNGELATTIPYLIEAMFQDFPGRSGVPTEVRVQPRP